MLSRYESNGVIAGQRLPWRGVLVALLVPALAGCGGDGGSGSGAKSASGGMAGASGSGGNGGTGGSAGSSAAGRGGNAGSSAAGRGGTSPSGGTGGMETKGLSLVPRGTTLIFGASQTFTCMVTGFTNRECTFTLDEGAAAGTVTDEGRYTAPSTAGTYHLTATSVADSSLSQTSTIRVVSPGSPGEWINVTPDSVHLEREFHPLDNYGTQDVVADPVTQSDLWAFICYQGVWKSTDYGVTWNKVSTGTNSAELETGRPWAAAVEPTKNRDPGRPPVLYTANGYGTPLGIFKSVDGGVNWTLNQGFPEHTAQDVYSIEINPYDSQHVLVGFHERDGVAESLDGGDTWIYHSTGDNAGISLFPFFIDTGNAETTRRTWMTVAQVSGGENGTRRTSDGGATWTKVNGLEHGHGTCQIDQQGDGVIYAGGAYGDEGTGIYRSDDYGVTWELVNNGANETTLFGTPNYLYAEYAQGFEAGSAGLQWATRANGRDWQNMPEPPGMVDGAKRAAVVYDGMHHILVTSNWNAGLWRYVEP